MESTFHFYLGGSASTGSKRSFRLDPICTETLFPAGLRRVRYAWCLGRRLDPGNTKSHRTGVWNQTVNLCVEKGVAFDRIHAEELLMKGEALYG